MLCTPNPILFSADPETERIQRLPRENPNYARVHFRNP
jgi:hypothetical protein